jgi:hypothetical protein
MIRHSLSKTPGGNTKLHEIRVSKPVGGFTNAIALTADVGEARKVAVPLGLAALRRTKYVSNACANRPLLVASLRWVLGPSARCSLRKTSDLLDPEILGLRSKQGVFLSFSGEYIMGNFDYVQICGYKHHPNANKNGVVLEHRLVVSNIMGRPLRPDEVVHHIDGNKKNNTPINLRLMTNSEHVKLHAKGRTYMCLECCCCGKKFDRDIRGVNYKIKRGQTDFFCSRSCCAKTFGRGRKRS